MKRVAIFAAKVFVYLLAMGVLWTLINLFDCWGHAPTIFSIFGNGC